ncbi:MAG: hypothetical protein AAF718_06880 [Pseudomonadota bacterium]
MATVDVALDLFQEICIEAGPLFEDSIAVLRSRGTPEAEGRHFEIPEWEINFSIGSDFSFLTQEHEKVCTMEFKSPDDRSALVQAVKARYGEQRYGLFVSREFGKPIGLEISFNTSGNISKHEIKAYEYMLVS